VSATSPQGRFPAEKVDGQRLTGVDAYGKHLLVEQRSRECGRGCRR